jgi:hypothetical protein
MVRGYPIGRSDLEMQGNIERSSCNWMLRNVGIIASGKR